MEQDVDFVLKNMKLKNLGQPHDEVLMMTDSRYKSYKANGDRKILKMAYCSENILAKQVTLNNSKVSSPSPKAIS